MSNPYSRRVPLSGSPVTMEMIDTGLILKRSFDLTATVAETFVAVLVAKVTDDHVIPFEERMQT